MDYFFKELFDDGGPEGEEEPHCQSWEPKEAPMMSSLIFSDKSVNEVFCSKRTPPTATYCPPGSASSSYRIPVGIGILMAIIGIFIAAVSVILAFLPSLGNGKILLDFFIIEL